MIDKHRVSVCEPVYANGQWLPAFKVEGAVHDEFVGRKIMLTVESDDYNESNYYLLEDKSAGNSDLLIHNMKYDPNPC